jgi:hypothetical protein
MRELLRAKGTIDYTSRGAVDRPNRATFKPLITKITCDVQHCRLFYTLSVFGGIFLTCDACLDKHASQVKNMQC